MYIDIVPNRRSRPAVLLREAWREGGRVRKRTLANLSKLPMAQIESLRRVLRGEKLVPAGVFKVVSSRTHGHVAAVLKAMAKLGIGRLTGVRCRERALVEAMVAARVLRPDSHVATTRWWRTTTLPELLGVASADEDELSETMDWLLARQPKIEKKLLSRQLGGPDPAFFYPSSRDFEGATCPRPRRRHEGDRQQNELRIHCGLLTTAEGCPVSISVLPGETETPQTPLPPLETVRKHTGVRDLVLVGDPNVVTQECTERLRDLEGVWWLTGLRPGGLRRLLEDGAIEQGQFDGRGLLELTHAHYPGERLLASLDRHVAKSRARQRRRLLQATADALDRVRTQVAHGRLRAKERIARRVGAAANRYGVARHFDLDLAGGRFDFAVNEDQVVAEAALDGLCVVRTNVSARRLSAARALRRYEDVGRVERVFQALDGVDLLTRAVPQQPADCARAHLLLAMLAYYVRWHMEEAWRPLLLSDEDLEIGTSRDRVASAHGSPEGPAEWTFERLPHGVRAHEFQALLDGLGTIVRNTCVAPGDKGPGGEDAADTFEADTEPDEAQQRAYALLDDVDRPAAWIGTR